MMYINFITKFYSRYSFRKLCRKVCFSLIISEKLQDKQLLLLRNENLELIFFRLLKILFYETQTRINYNFFKPENFT